MHTAITEYIAELDSQYQTGTATEHTYRPALQRLLADMMPELTITNEPKRIACGAPDYIITDNQMPVGYVEAKDIGADLNAKVHREQFDRYKQSLDNLIITDYLTFQWFLYGELRQEIVIGQRKDKRIVAESSVISEFQDLIRSFSVSRSRGIKDTEQLAKVLANKAKLLANNIARSLDTDEKTGQGSMLNKHLQNFRKVLLSGMKIREFSDMYAQTIAYGMFAAWLNDTKETTPNPSKGGELFTRGKAELLIPHSNPFLRKFFRDIADDELDARINWVVDALADSFNYTNRTSIDAEFDQKDHDPVIHFYETFLAEYNPALRKSRGVWYTPLPAVRFIIQAVDDILKKEFSIAQGLADRTDRVQILDPALGTGNFLAETIRHTYEHFQTQQGMWQSYVSNHLLPRLNGFEILMAPYAMAHLKLGMLLRQTGYKAPASERLRIYLTNSLEEAQDKTKFLTLDWLSDEASEASRIKQDVPIMVVMGNPPYNVSTQNKNDWIDGMISDYKTGLQERNIQPLSDDYIKFIRLGQDYIKRNPAGMGVLAFISNNSFIDGLIHRQMRKYLLETFDKIYILNLHGSARRQESAPDGGKDENVFDIQQGVSINIFVKTGRKPEGALATVFHADLYGRRKEKFAFLRSNGRNTVQWQQLEFNDDNYFFVPKNFSMQKKYGEGFKVNELLPVNSTGVKFRKDNLLVKNNFTPADVKQMLWVLNTKEDYEIQKMYSLQETQDWKLKDKKVLFVQPDHNDIRAVYYRPFDHRYTYYPLSKIDKIIVRGDSRKNLMQHFIKGENVGLLTCRQQSTFDFQHVLVTKVIADMCVVSTQGSESAYLFPLYLYPDTDELLENGNRKPNLNATIVNEICQRTALQFTEEKETTTGTFAPIDLLDYIYAVLHSPSYRQRYKEFLKIDFPRVPYPESAKEFLALAALGTKLRRLHLMEGVEPSSDLANFPIAGTNEVETLQYTDSKVRINETQYFDNVPSEAWSFYIGGYQPAQKWLKDRKGRALSFDDIIHYQKIVRVLKETREIMNEIDKIEPSCPARRLHTIRTR